MLREFNSSPKYRQFAIVPTKFDFYLLRGRFSRIGNLIYNWSWYWNSPGALNRVPIETCLPAEFFCKCSLSSVCSSPGSASKRCSFRLQIFNSEDTKSRVRWRNDASIAFSVGGKESWELYVKKTQGTSKSNKSLRFIRFYDFGWWHQSQVHPCQQVKAKWVTVFICNPWANMIIIHRLLQVWVSNRV